jgi:hypothetical protein
MGSSESFPYYEYNSKGVVVTKPIRYRRVGWVKILDIMSEDDKNVKYQVEADDQIPFLHNNSWHPLVLRKKNANYVNIKEKIVKGVELYVETGDYGYNMTKIMLTSILNPPKITATIIFGKYEFNKIMPPDVFSTQKTDAHWTCEKYCFLVSDSKKFNFVKNCEYIITATNKHNEHTYIVDSACLSKRCDVFE